jgi:hypothetical protein
MYGLTMASITAGSVTPVKGFDLRRSQNDYTSELTMGDRNPPHNSQLVVEKVFRPFLAVSCEADSEWKPVSTEVLDPDILDGL